MNLPKVSVAQYPDHAILLGEKHIGLGQPEMSVAQYCCWVALFLSFLGTIGGSFSDPEFLLLGMCFMYLDLVYFVLPRYHLGKACPDPLIFILMNILLR